MTTNVQLHDKLDYHAVAPLLAELTAIDDPELVLDASQIRHLGAQCLLVLLSSIKTRAAAGHTTELMTPSDQCTDCLDLFGFTPETFTQPEMWS